MTHLPLRVPPNGPYVENDEGGRIAPASGFQLRRRVGRSQGLDQVLTSTAELVVGVGGGSTEGPPLSGVDLGLFYRPEADISGGIDNDEDASSCVVDFIFEYSTDGAAWTAMLTETKFFPPVPAASGRIDFDIRLWVPPTQGADLTGVSQGDDLHFRVLAQGGYGDASADEMQLNRALPFAATMQAFEEL